MTSGVISRPALEEMTPDVISHPILKETTPDVVSRQKKKARNLSVRA
jgi:hypothetical protein